MSKESIRLKIEIRKSPEEVFSYLKNIERRLRLNPSYKLISFEFLTPEPVKVGTKYKVTVQTKDMRFSYIGVVREFVENQKMVTEDSEGKLRLTYLLRPTKEGTELSYIEEFELPMDILIKEEEERSANIFTRILEFFFKTGGFCQHEIQRRKLRLLEDLERKAQIWLKTIKDDIEKIS